MKLQMTDAEVKHLRLTLAWLRVEFCLDEDMQKGSLTTVKQLLDAGMITQSQALNEVSNRAAQIKQVPKYVRQAMKMLTKMIGAHDGIVGYVVETHARKVSVLSAAPTPEEP